ncbi:MAG: hypothetical protein IH608_09060, partial [Proteobacteria bacterium]|nr:hypothetical protein [Pseudomonadota bacterium]
YRGRIGVFELLVPDDHLRNLILARAPQAEIESAVLSNGFRTLIQDGLVKAVEGITTYEEVRGIK